MDDLLGEQLAKMEAADAEEEAKALADVQNPFKTLQDKEAKRTLKKE